LIKQIHSQLNQAVNDNSELGKPEFNASGSQVYSQLVGLLSQAESKLKASHMSSDRQPLRDLPSGKPEEYFSTKAATIQKHIIQKFSSPTELEVD